MINWTPVYDDGNEIKIHDYVYDYGFITRIESCLNEINDIPTIVIYFRNPGETSSYGYFSFQNGTLKKNFEDNWGKFSNDMTSLISNHLNPCEYFDLDPMKEDDCDICAGNDYSSCSMAVAMDMSRRLNKLIELEKDDNLID
jgi:hypothetical protein